MTLRWTNSAGGVPHTTRSKFGGSSGWDKEAARATTYLDDTHRIPLAEALAALDERAAAAITTAATPAAVEKTSDEGKTVREKENELQPEAKKARSEGEPLSPARAPKVSGQKGRSSESGEWGRYGIAVRCTRLKFVGCYLRGSSIAA